MLMALLLLGAAPAGTEGLDALYPQLDALYLDLHQNPELGWSFYALNGTNANDCRADNGLLNWAWNNVSSRPLQVGLRSIQATPGLLPASLTRPVLPGSYTGRRPRSSTSRLCLLP